MATVSVRPAFKYEFGPGTLKRVEAVRMPADRTFLWSVVVVCLFVHGIVLYFNPSWFFDPPQINMENDQAVDVDFIGELSMKAPQQTALPNAKKSDEVAVPSNLLPQLPKKFEVEQAKKPEEKPVVLERDPKADDAVAPKQVANPEKIETPVTKEDPNKVTQEDLLKRLALEKLKKENKLDQTLKAEKNALAKLKEDLSKQDSKTNSGTGSTTVSALRAKTYADLLRAAVKRNLFLPKSFEYDRATMSTQLSVVISSTGELVSVKMSHSSGNGAYDQAAMAALQNSIPLPPPPAEFVGQIITFNLSK